MSLEFQPEFHQFPEPELSDFFDKVNAEFFIKEHRRLDGEKRLDIQQSAATIPATIDYASKASKIVVRARGATKMCLHIFV